MVFNDTGVTRVPMRLANRGFDLFVGEYGSVYCSYRGGRWDGRIGLEGFDLDHIKVVGKLYELESHIRTRKPTQINKNMYTTYLICYDEYDGWKKTHSSV